MTRYSRMWTMVVWVPTLLLLMAGILFVSSQKTVVISSDQSGEFLMGVDGVDGIAAVKTKWNVTLSATSSEKYFYIPLPDGIKAENITVENKYQEKIMKIRIRGELENFYREHPIYGNVEKICSARGEFGEQEIYLTIYLDSVYELNTTLVNGALRVAYFNPRDYYEKIVVIEPTKSLNSEDYETIVKIIRLIPDYLTTDSVKIYFPMTEGLSARELLSIAEGDYYLELGFYEGESEVDYGIIGGYNDVYFNPEQINAEFADLLVRAVTTSCSNRSVRIDAVAEGSFLRELTIPAAYLGVGNRLNKTEMTLFSEKQYRQRVASGIAQALDTFMSKNEMESE